MENGDGVGAGAKCSDGNGELEVGFAQEGNIMEQKGVNEEEEESGLRVCASVQEGNKGFGDGHAKLAWDFFLKEEGTKMKKPRGRPRKIRPEGENIEIKEEKPMKKRGRPRKIRTEGENIEIKEKKPMKRRRMPRKIRKNEVNIEVMEEKPRKKRGRPRQIRKEEESIEVLEEKPRKERGRPRQIRKEEVSIEVLENNGVQLVNNESMGNGELVGEEEAKDLNLENSNAGEAVQENGAAEKEGEKLGKENDRRSDEREKGKSDSGRRSLGQRKSRTEAQLKMVKLRVEDEEWEEEMRTTKRRRHQKGHENEVVCDENGGESEVNKGAGDGGNKKKPGRKPTKGLEKQEENDGRAGEFVHQNEKEQEGVDKKKVGRRQLKGKGQEEKAEEETEEGQSLGNYSLRVSKANTEEASRLKRLEDENVRSLVNVKLD